MSERLLVIGPGRMGLALGYALWQSEALESIVYCGRRSEPPAHPLFTQGIARYVYGVERPARETTAVLLAVPDEALTEVTEHLAAQGEVEGEPAAFHLSGALSTDALHPLHDRGYAVGSFHPLQSVVHPVTAAERLAGCSVSVAGEPAAIRVAHRLASALGCRPIQIPVRNRPLYHAAAVLASNNLAALVGTSVRLMVEAGLSEEDAVAALIPMARGTLANIEETGFRPSFDGPVASGDVETVGLHLRRLNPGARAMYATLARELLRLVEQVDDEEPAITQMRRLLENGG